MNPGHCSLRALSSFQKHDRPHNERHSSTPLVFKLCSVRKLPQSTLAFNPFNQVATVCFKIKKLCIFSPQYIYIYVLFYAGISQLDGWLLDFQEGFCYMHLVIGKGTFVHVLN